VRYHRFHWQVKLFCDHEHCLCGQKLINTICEVFSYSISLPIRFSFHRLRKFFLAAYLIWTITPMISVRSDCCVIQFLIGGYADPSISANIEWAAYRNPFGARSILENMVSVWKGESDVPCGFNSFRRHKLMYSGPQTRISLGRLRIKPEFIHFLFLGIMCELGL